MAVQQWEYRFIRIHASGGYLISGQAGYRDPEPAQKQWGKINDLSAEGWELVHVSNWDANNEALGIFKRQKVKEPSN
ncbi:MAG TPA: DUF4177 domain-containing protein [Blastocatellia bacterium]|nr:DUF4177 domain-containing protein [Blastocatellia bacterium]